MNFQRILNLALGQELEDRVRRNEENIQRRMLRDTTNPFELSEFEFHQCFRLSRDLARYFINLISPYLHQGRQRNSLSPEIKVLSCLAFFATGSYQQSIAQSMYFPVERSTLSKNITDITNVVVEHLVNRFVKFPQTELERQQVKQRFFEKFQFPGIIGAIDGTHIAIIAPDTDDPERPGLAYYNRKGYYSLNVQMICDADLKILNCNARFPGSTHDSGIWSLSSVRNHLEHKYLNNELNSSWLIGDAGYPLEPWLLTPIVEALPNTPEGRYTSCHILARNTVERCFGVLKQRFRCLLKHRVLHYSPEKAAKIVLSCVVLHNLAVDAGLNLPDEVEEEVDVQLADIQIYEGQQNYLHDARRVRARIIERYFNQ